MLSFLLYLSHLTSFLQLWPHILAFLRLLWWINCSCSTFVHLLHFFTDATISHFIRDTAQLILFSFIIRISLSTALLPSTHIHTVKLLPQKKERRIPLLSPCILPIMVSFLLFPLEQNPLKTLFILALYKLSFSIISWCHYIRALTYTPLKLFLSRSQWPPYVKTQHSCLNSHIICTDKEVCLLLPTYNRTHMYSQLFRTPSCQLWSFLLFVIIYLLINCLFQKSP